MKRLFVVLLCCLALAAGAEDMVLRQTVSREHPSLNVATSRLRAGLDGNVYLGQSDYVLRVAPDGSAKAGRVISRAMWGFAANADGVIATANAHFVHSVHLWGPDFAPRGRVADFLVNDEVEWQAPCDVVAGASGDFYGVDQNRDRIVRVTADGRLATTISLSATGESYRRKLVRIGVWEGGQRLYIANQSGQMHALGFDGAKAWTLEAGTGGNPWNGYGAAFAVDGDGRLWILPAKSDTIRLVGADGQDAGSLKLGAGGGEAPVTELDLLPDAILVKRRDPAVLFEVYDRQSGDFRHAVRAEVEELTVTVPADPWIAGQEIPVKIDFQPAPGKQAAMVWTAAISVLNAPVWESLSLTNGKVFLPGDAAGIYRFYVRQGEYEVQRVVEIREPDSRGTATACTPLNRYWYGRGEPIPVTVHLRGEELPTEGSLLIEWPVIRHEMPLAFEAGTATATLPGGMTATWPAGRYKLTPLVPGFTGVPQWIELGNGLDPRPTWHMVQYGDYHMAYDGREPIWTAPETIRRDLGRAQTLGLNLIVDRLGHGGSGGLGDLYSFPLPRTAELQALKRRLEQDPLAVSPAKLEAEPPLRQAIAARGAVGIEQQGILLYMDAGLPIGTLWDKRKPEQMDADLRKATEAVREYPGFRGWSWAANWWFEKRGAKSAPTPELEAAYKEALAKANANGEWSPILDTVSDIWIDHPIAAEKRFDAILQELAPGRLSVITAPYRQPGIVPPLTYANADEIDLHVQAEQIQWPQITGHNVDFYLRPGKPAWGHPEVWNDDGTGNMLFPTVLQMAMRGADGVGWSGSVPGWGGSPSNDPRATGLGTVSSVRAMTRLLNTYGPWLQTLDAADPIVIPVSQRMMRIDDWKGIGGLYFTRLYEAWNACLYAGRPARFVFTADCTPESFLGSRAVLLVGQTVEWDAPLKAAIDRAREAGIPVFADATCRDSLVADHERLPVAFDRVEQDPHTWQDDSAYPRFFGYFRDHAAALDTAFGERVPPLARTSAPELLLTERRAGEGRFLWVLNNTSLPLDPGLAWRTSLIMSQRLPVVAPVELPAGGVVYDVFAQRKIAGGQTEVDLRHLPARLYAILPRPIDGVSLEVAGQPEPGHPFRCRVKVISTWWRETGATLPVRLGLLDRRGDVHTERTLAVPSAGLEVDLILPQGVNAAVLIAIELVAGKQATVQLGGKVEPPSVSPLAHAFGAHLRDVAINGDTALLNAMNWDANLYALDLADGSLRWQRRLGQHFAYGPTAAGDGWAVMGFDYATAEGYHLYRLASDGTPERRFALYGLPKRATGWAAGHRLSDPIANAAAAPDGSWFATAGDLGLAVWNADGSLRWQHDAWRDGRRPRTPLLALGNDALLVLDGEKAIARDAASGAERWRFTAEAELAGAAATADGATVALRSPLNGGRVYLLRDGKLINTLYANADELAFAQDGATLLAIDDRLLAWYAIDAGLIRQKRAGDRLHGIAIAPDGRAAVGSEMGELYVLAPDGSVVHQSLLHALPRAAWLPGGDLLVATWMGRCLRLDGTTFKPRWERLIRNEAPPTPAQVAATPEALRDWLLTPDTTPISRVDGWGNALPTPLPLTPNLLADEGATIGAIHEPPSHGDPRPWHHPATLLTDGDPASPPSPWLEWTDINYIDSGWRKQLTLTVDSFHRQLRVEAVTFVEDPAHPETWLRDVRLQWWDAEAELWRDGPLLLSDSAIHSHRIEPAIEAGRFRFVTTGGGTWPAANLRLAELVFHGEPLGASHPDVVNRRPVATLIDEDSAIVRDAFIHGHNPSLKLLADGTAAFHGGHCLELGARGDGPTTANPRHRGALEHTVPTWDFEIVEQPAPGQYRYLQFAWMAAEPTTRAIGLRVGAGHAGGVGILAGEGLAFDRAKAVNQEATPPTAWQEVTVDLYEAAGGPFRLRSLTFGTLGGTARFDRIRLLASRPE